MFKEFARLSQKSSHVFAGDGQRVVARSGSAEAECRDAGATDVLAAVDIAVKREANCSSMNDLSINLIIMHNYIDYRRSNWI